MKKPQKSPQAVEGEGSYIATRKYNAEAEAWAKSGAAEEAGKAASKALDGPEGPALRQADAAGRAGNPRPHGGVSKPSPAAKIHK
jgi:hypothetical protein